MGTLRLGIMQMGRVDDLRSGMKKISDLASTLGRVDVAALPEMWIAGALDGASEDQLARAAADIAARLNGTLIVGGYVASRAGRQLIVSRAISSDGVVAEASKRFPSNAVGERTTIAPGSGPTAFDSAAAKVGIVLCVDAAYPELVRLPALSGATLVVNVASIPFDRIYLWRALAQARAAENTIYFAFVNLTAAKYRDGRSVEGNSMIASPNGRIVLELGRGEVAEVGVLDMDEVQAVRGRWPYLDDIRDFYRGRAV